MSALKRVGRYYIRGCQLYNTGLNFFQIGLHFGKWYTAIPYRESTGFLQGIPCVVFPPLHALAVYRV